MQGGDFFIKRGIAFKINRISSPAGPLFTCKGKFDFGSRVFYRSRGEDDSIHTISPRRAKGMDQEKDNEKSDKERKTKHEDKVSDSSTGLLVDHFYSTIKK